MIWGSYIFLLWRWGHWRPLPSGSAPTSLQVAVVIPVRNEAKTLPACLESLLGQTYKPHEIWIVNDHSEDHTLEIAYAYKAQEKRIQVLSLPEGVLGKKAALQAAIYRTQADIIVTMDADTVSLPNTLEKLLSPFCDPSIQVVGGWIRLVPEKGLLVAFQRIELSGVLVLTAGSWQRGKPLTANGALLAYRRTAFLEVGGWGNADNHPSGDDDLLVQRIVLRYGAQAIAFSSAITETRAAKSWHTFLHQRLRWISKRHLYPSPWTPQILRLTALAQISLLCALFLFPKHALLAWGLLFGIQAWTAYKGFILTQSPLPSLPYWLLTGILYPFYQAVMVGLAFWGFPFEWKGRLYKKGGAKAIEVSQN